MVKPILVVNVPLTEEELKELKELAPTYKVVETLEEGDPVEDVAIMYGWNQSLGQRILSTPSNQLKWIQAESAGYDHIDIESLNQQHILLSNASGIHGHQMSESILGMIFAHTRKIKEAILQQEKKNWLKPEGLSDLNGKKVMIVGTGHIGERLAEILQVFQTEVTGVNRKGREVPHFDHIVRQENIQTVIGDMDIIISLLPDSMETKHFFNKELFSIMKPGVMFINAGRGGTVNTADLIDYCQNQTIGFAGLDVFEEEPLPETSPLWQLENCLITPHSSGMSDQYYRRLHPIFMANFTHFLKTGDIEVNKINLT